MIRTFFSLSIVRQLCGAAAGALIALALFRTYRAAAPVMRATLLPAHAPAALETTTENSVAFLPSAVDAPAQDDAFDESAEERDDSLVPVASVERLQDAAARARNERIERMARDTSVVEPMAAEQAGGAAPALPNAGVGVWILAGIALLVSVMVRGRRGWRTED